MVSWWGQALCSVPVRVDSRRTQVSARRFVLNGVNTSFVRWRRVAAGSFPRVVAGLGLSPGFDFGRRLRRLRPCSRRNLGGRLGGRIPLVKPVASERPAQAPGALLLALRVFVDRLDAHLVRPPAARGSSTTGGRSSWSTPRCAVRWCRTPLTTDSFVAGPSPSRAGRPASAGPALISAPRADREHVVLRVPHLGPALSSMVTRERAVGAVGEDDERSRSGGACSACAQPPRSSSARPLMTAPLRFVLGSCAL